MTEETIVAVYDDALHADAAVRDLEAINVPKSAISRHSGASMQGEQMSSKPVREKGFWAGLFGGDSGYHETVYDRSMTEGSSVVSVKVPDHDVVRVSEVLERHNPVDMDERASIYGVGNYDKTTSTATTSPTGFEDSSTAGAVAAGTAPVGATTSGTTTTNTTSTGSAYPATGQSTSTKTGGEEVIRLAEEQLSVGKRLINRGTTRIRRFVVETPVEEAVTLRSENVSIERRPVAPGTRVTDADFSDKVIEVTESDEEAVVGKTTHLKEEVVINKEAAERVETVRDTVRHEDVEITKDNRAEPTSGTLHPDGSTPRSAV